MRPGSRTIQRRSAMGAGLGLERVAVQPERAPAAPLKARAGRGVAHVQASVTEAMGLKPHSSTGSKAVGS